MRIFAGLGILLVSVALWLPGQSKSQSRLKQPPVAEAPKPAAPAPVRAELPAGPVPSAPASEKLTYNVEWRLIHAGSVTVESKSNWGRLKLESAGLVSKLFKIDDVYAANYDDVYCATITVLDAIEG